MHPKCRLEREDSFTRQPPQGDKEDYDSENSWISGGISSNSRRSRRGGGGSRGERPARPLVELRMV